jgi:hypothetical protein
MLVRETDKITFRRIKYKFKTLSNMNTVTYNTSILVHWKGTDSEVVFFKFMTVFFSQRNAACF